MALCTDIPVIQGLRGSTPGGSLVWLLTLSWPWSTSVTISRLLTLYASSML